jgi:hypothetical protein
MRKLFLAIQLVFFACNAYSQEVAPQPDAKLVATFPFKMYNGGVMVLQARLGNIEDTLNFILDTGGGGVSLDSATCTQLNILPVATDTTITGIAGVVKVPFVFNQVLHLPGMDVEKLNFHVVDYSVLTSVYGERIDGVIGYSFFSRYIIKINFDSAEIEVYQPGKISYPRGGALLHPIFTAMPIQWLHLKDARKLGFNFYMDTGAGLCLLLSEQFAKDSSILLSRRKPVITQAEGVGGKLQMRLTVVKRLRVGPYVFYNVPTYLYADSFNLTAYPFVGGLIGNDLLRRFNLTFNYPAREVHLLPNSRFREPFDYAYTGLAIYFEDNLIKVEEVVPGSPAHRAGLLPGDVLIAVGNNFSNNIMAYKTILQNSDDKIKVIVQRDKKLVELFLKPVSIL